MIDLDKLQEMWEKDSKIDMDNLQLEIVDHYQIGRAHV